MSKEQQELLDEVYVNYTKVLIGSITFSEREKHFKSNGLEFNSGYPNYIHHTQEEFINKCKTDTEFSQRWGLKIEERELSLEERRELVSEDIARGRVLDRNGLNQGDFGDISPFTEKIIHYWMNQFNIPTKLITITYNDKTIESYE